MTKLQKHDLDFCVYLSEIEYEKKLEYYKKCFEGLSDKEKKLLAYRKIIELTEKEELSNEIPKNKELVAIMEATEYKCGFIKPLILSICSDSEKECRELYKDSLISYKKVLENYKMLAEELNIDKSLELSHLLTYMLWNGYYSVDKTHNYKLEKRLFLPGMYSFDVIKGGGVCLAYSELLHNYLTVCDQKSSLLLCKVPTDKKSISCDYRPEIERHTKINFTKKVSNKILTTSLKPIIKKNGNHAITLIEENDKLYAYDSTNLFVLNVLDENTCSIVNGKGEFEIKPFVSIMLTPYGDPNKLFDKLLSDDKKEGLTRKEVIFSFENTLELINDNITLLDDAYDNIHSELEIIDKQTSEIGKYSKKRKKSQSL